MSPLHDMGHCAGNDKWKRALETPEMEAPVQQTRQKRQRLDTQRGRLTRDNSGNGSVQNALDASEVDTDVGALPAEHTDNDTDNDLDMSDDVMPQMDVEHGPLSSDDGMPQPSVEYNNDAEQLHDAPAPLVGQGTLTQMRLTLEGGNVGLCRAPPPSEVLDNEVIVEPQGAAPHQSCPTKPIWQHFLGEHDPDRDVLPGEHRVVTPTDEATDRLDHVPQVEVPQDLEPLDAYLLASGGAGDGQVITDLHSECSDAPELVEGDNDDEGNGWLGGCLEDRNPDGLVDDKGTEDTDIADQEDPDSTKEPGSQERERESPNLNTGMFDTAQLKALQQFLALGMRARGGEGEAVTDSEDEAGPAPVGNEEIAAEPDVGDNLLCPVWKSQDTECCLKVLQLCQLVSEMKERHRSTGPALEDLLKLLQVVLPPGNVMPRSLHMFRKVSRRVLRKVFGGPSFKRLHMCSDPECIHMYTDWDSEKCPLCGKARYKVENGVKLPEREMRYMGPENGLRTLLMSQQVGKAISSFDLRGTLDDPHTLLSCGWSEHICAVHIPDYSAMDPDERKRAKFRFFLTGQVFSSEAEWLRYNDDVECKRCKRSVLLVVEAGCDGFQPFRRRIWSTWMWGYRITNVNWALGNLAQVEIVTAISEGATEGKAAHVVAALDAEELKAMAPPTAEARDRGPSGVTCPSVTHMLDAAVPLAVPTAHGEYLLYTFADIYDTLHCS
jgi:hypothetical protein